MGIPLLLFAALLLLAFALGGVALGRRLGRGEGRQALAQERHRWEEARQALLTDLALARQEKEQLTRLGGDLRREAQALQEKLAQAQGQAARLETAAAKDREALAQERRQVEEGRRLLGQELENLANRIFESRQQVFQVQSRESLASLLSPLREQLASFRQRVDQVHAETIQGRTFLKGELERLRDLNQQITREAADLTRALKGDKKLQGNWGEHKVELLLEQAGLRKGVEYLREHSVQDEEGNRLRPDFLVNLPEGRHLVIDSKVSLVDYAAFVSSEDPQERQRRLAAHVGALRNHIRALGEKGYPALPGVDAPDFTFMFIAVEPAYLVAAEHCPSLFEEAFERRVALVTATTLLPVLRVAAHLWSLQRRNQSTQALAEQAGKVHEKLRVFLEKMDKLGRQLETAQRTYRESMDTLKDGRGSLVRTVEGFRELGVKVTRKLPGSLAGTDDGEGPLEEG
jgi:DNA recombination protein RmuC